MDSDQTLMTATNGPVAGCGYHDDGAPTSITTVSGRATGGRLVRIMAILIVLGAFLVAGLIGGLAIGQMERSRGRAMGLRAISGVVVGKYTTGEHGEIQLPFRGAGTGGVSVAPESWILSVNTGGDVT